LPFKRPVPEYDARVNSNLGGLVPPDTDNCSTSSPFLYLIMASLGTLSTEQPVLAYTHSDPAFHQQVQHLSAAVSAAGERVRDEGRIRNDFDDNLRIFSPVEIWLFDLAVDVIAMLGSLMGLSNASLALYKDNVRTLDDEVHTHTWKHGLKKAGAGPEEFRELRQRVPHHPVHPMRY
jgi:hypothetical protein